MNLYALKDSPFHSSVFNHFAFYSNKFNHHPNFFESRIPLKTSILDKILNLDGEEVFVHNLEVKKKKKEDDVDEELDKSEKIGEFVYVYKDSMIILNWSTSHHFHYSDYDADVNFSKYYIKVLYLKKETLDEIKSLFEYVIEKNKNNVHLLCRMDGELVTQKFEVKLPQKDFDLELNYGKEVVLKTESLISNLKDNKSGLALFSGPPGTGKSTYIKYLSTTTNRRIIYLPSSSIEEITSPDFLTFIIDYKNSILLLEDAEKVLKSREIQENTGISNILNMTDGLLGDCLNIFIIATFNTTRDQIDSALLRKGRLILEHQFDELSPENCNKIFEKINSDRRTEKPLSLAEIYNDQDNYSKKEEKRKVGF